MAASWSPLSFCQGIVNLQKLVWGPTMLKDLRGFSLGAALTFSLLFAFTPALTQTTIENAFTDARGHWTLLGVDTLGNVLRIKVDTNGNLRTYGVPSTAWYSTGKVTVSSAVATQLFSGDTSTSSVSVYADPDNTGDIYIGPSNGVTTANGKRLVAGASIDLPVDNLNKVWALSTVNGEFAGLVGVQ